MTTLVLSYNKFFALKMIFPVPIKTDISATYFGSKLQQIVDGGEEMPLNLFYEIIFLIMITSQSIGQWILFGARSIANLKVYHLL